MKYNKKQRQKILYIVTLILAALFWYFAGNAWHGIILGLGMIITNILLIDDL